MAKATKKKIEIEDCPWESGQLGNSIEHAVPAPAEHEKTLDEAMGLQMISIRLPKALIDDLKYFAEREGLGYQPLMRRILIRWAGHEYKLEAQEKFASSLGTPTIADTDYAELECDSKIAAYG